MRHNLMKESENTDRWLVSYADFITLLFAFFVVMYSVSQVNEGKFKILSETLTEAFRQPERSLQPIQIGEVNKSDTVSSGESTYPEENETHDDYMTENATTESNQSFEELRKDLTESLKELIKEDLVKIRSNQDWLEVNTDSGLLFESGSDRLNSNGILFYKNLSGPLKDAVAAIKIRGYTDNKPINTIRFPSNWALSSARAVAVAQIFEQNGINPDRMAVEGYGEHQPEESNDTVEGRRANRRVVIAISRYPPSKSKFEREADTLIPNTVASPIDNSEQVETQITLIRAADGSLIIRGSSTNDDTDNQ